MDPGVDSKRKMSACIYMILEEMKEHINVEHRKTSPAHYQFSYWILNTKDKSEKEVSKNRHTIYPKDW